MTQNKAWTRQELLLAFGLYCELPFGKLHYRNPDIIRLAAKIGRTPSALAMKLTNVASLDPAITASGRKGLAGASSADKALWKEMQSDWSAFISALAFAMEELGITELTQEPRHIEQTGINSDEESFLGGEKWTLAKARVGQNFFRRTVLSAYNYRCCMSGLSLPGLLVASHIVPWRTEPIHRLNPKNGLLLSVLHDKAFDSGILTVDEDMRIVVANLHNTQDDLFFQSALQAYHGRRIALPEKLNPSAEFLYYHREHLFKG